MLIKPGNHMTFGDIKVTVLKGHHIQFDKELELHTVDKQYPNLPVAKPKAGKGIRII